MASLSYRLPHSGNMGTTMTETISLSQEVVTWLAEDGIEVISDNVIKLSLPPGRRKVEFEAAEPRLPIDDLTPKASEFLKVECRTLSAGLVRWGRALMDFGKSRMLKKHLGVFQPKGARQIPFMVDHWHYVHCTTGSVINAFWSKGEDGLDTPGINQVGLIDKRLYPEFARMLLNRQVSSVSFTGHVAWEQSHPKMESDIFWRSLGAEVDGQVVRMVVVEIYDNLETSFVWTGADRDAKVISIETATEADLKHCFKEEVKTLEAELSHKPTPDSGTQTAEEAQMMKALLTALGKLTENAVTEENAVEQVTLLMTKLTELKTKVEELTAQLEAEKPMVEAGKSYVAELRNSLLTKATLKAKAENKEIDAELKKQLEEGNYKELQFAASVYGVGLKDILQERTSEEVDLGGDDPKETQKPLPNLGRVHA